MIRIQTALLLILVSAITALKAQEYTILAKLTGFPNGTLFNLTNGDSKVIDSVRIQDGLFKISGKLDMSPTELFLSTMSEGQKYWCIVFIDNGKINLTGDKQDFPFNLQITGSTSQTIYNKLIQQTKSLLNHSITLSKSVGKSLNDKSDSGVAKLRALGKEINYYQDLIDSITMKFIVANINSYPALYHLWHLRQKISLDSLKQLYNKVTGENKICKYSERLYRYINVGEILEVGNSYVNFVAKDMSGNSHTLSQYIGKYVLLDFSETYCGPCIASVDELKEVGESYSDSLTIISFCVDELKEVWSKGFERDKPTWVSLWNGEGYDGQTVLKYGVDSYPTFFLLNPEGRIISKWAGYAKGIIAKKISEKMSKNGNAK